jgi:hypothetical protein
MRKDFRWFRKAGLPLGTGEDPVGFGTGVHVMMTGDTPRARRECLHLVLSALQDCVDSCPPTDYPWVAWVGSGTEHPMDWYPVDYGATWETSEADPEMLQYDVYRDKDKDTRVLGIRLLWGRAGGGAIYNPRDTIGAPEFLSRLGGLYNDN